MPRPTPEPGDYVLWLDDDNHPLRERLGRIVRLHEDSPGWFRVAYCDGEEGDASYDGDVALLPREEGAAVWSLLRRPAPETLPGLETAGEPADETED